MTTTTKLLLALSAATLGVVVWAIRKKSRVGPLGKVNYADVKDPKADTIQEGPPKRIGQGPALKKWKCTSADLKASPWANAVRLVMTKDAKRQGKVVSCSADLCEQVQPLRSAHREEMHVLGLDTKNRVIGSALVAAGSVAETTVDAAEVFKPALLMNARRVVIVHNHPSGDPTPSPSDVQLTRKLTTAGEYLHVTLLDHLVIGDEGKCISMRDMGLVHRE